MENSNLFIGAGNLALNWQKQEGRAAKMKTFLLSLDEGDIGTGRMSYDVDKFELIPRSKLSSSQIWQFIVNIGNAQATFEANQDGFSKLMHKAKKIHESVTQFKPESCESCPKEAKKFLITMMNIRNVVQQVAQPGLNKLRDNYRYLKKDAYASQLESLGLDTFSYIRKTEEHMYNILLPLFPELEKDAEIKKYYSSSESVLLNRDTNRSDLRGVMWGKDRGLVIPMALVNDCIADAAIGKKGPNRAALQVAANHIGIPKMASIIPNLDKDGFWSPHRIVEKKGSAATIEEGVVGSCEKGANLCNIYSRFERRTEHAMVTSGVIDTPLKVEQIVKVLTSSFSKEIVGPRVIVHQLNSLSREEKLVKGTLALIPYLKELLNQENYNVTIAQQLTCFNAASKLSGEKKAFEEINRDFLLRITGDICVSTESVTNVCKDLSLLDVEVKNAVHWLDQAEEFEKNVKDWPKGFEEGQNDDHPRGARGKTTLSDLRDCVKVAREEYDKSLQKLPGLLLVAIQLLEKNKDLSVEQKRTLLLFRLLERIWTNQLNFPKPYSSTSEIESYLLLYRIMKWTPIFTCKKGLDRSGGVRALADAQYQLEKHFYRDILTTKNSQPNPETASRIEAQEFLYDLLVNLDELKNELFELTNLILAELKFPLAKDMTDLTAMQNAEVAHAHLPNELEQGIPINLRNIVLHRIAGKVNPEKRKALNDVQYYLEMVFGAQLVHLEMSLNSSGAIGSKYHYGSSNWFYRKAMNPHPFVRWPLFILTDKNIPIQLLECRQPGWLSETIQNMFSDPITVTPSAIALICRLSELR